MPEMTKAEAIRRIRYRIEQEPRSLNYVMVPREHLEVALTALESPAPDPQEDMGHHDKWPSPAVQEAREKSIVDLYQAARWIAHHHGDDEKRVHAWAAFDAARNALISTVEQPLQEQIRELEKLATARETVCVELSKDLSEAQQTIRELVEACSKENLPAILPERLIQAIEKAETQV